jgi:phenylalanine-4-hydroxylase
LPIASDMRTINHLKYTPAPDIVHEAAGHAPILADPEYAAYLRQYGEVARHSILSKEDLAQYEAIRILSDMKENPTSTTDDIARAEQRLKDVNGTIQHVSEAALLSRMNWWTAEYGLIGSLSDPKIFGAGLLSSLGEARECLNPKIKRIPLSVDCVNYSYDITEPQPQLFVAKDFGQLNVVLEDLAVRLAYRRGGAFGLDRALEAETVNTVQLNSGIQISGLLKSYDTGDSPPGAPSYYKFLGPCQLSYAYQQLPEQGVVRHAHGFSSPVGLLKNHRRCLSTYSPENLANMALQRGERARIEFESGVRVEGLLKEWTYCDGKLVVLTWVDCRVTLRDQLLFDPAWGEFDLAVGSQITSVFGGPADRAHFTSAIDFVNNPIPPKKFGTEESQRHAFFARLRALREDSSGVNRSERWHELIMEFLAQPKLNWLQGVELLELSYTLGISEATRLPLLRALEGGGFADLHARECVLDGVKIASQEL